MKIFIKILNLFNYLLFLFVQFFLKFIRVEIKEKTLLIIRIDAIGDYILFRNYLGELKKSKKFKDYKITLCGNMLWKNLSENLDRIYVDDFIWLNRKKFYWNIFYKYNFLRKVRKAGFEVVVDTTYSREILYGDAIVRSSGAKEKIGSVGSSEKHTEWKRNFLTNKFYTKLISTTDKNIFEFYRNKEFFENLTDEKIKITKPEIDINKKEINNFVSEKYAILFPGAGHKKRMWSIENFIEIAKYIYKKFNLQIVIAGSKSDSKIAMKLMFGANCGGTLCLTGGTTLLELVKLISEAKILITNETGAAHIAAAVNCPFVCVSNGNHYGRFNPYPEEIYSNCVYVYPEEIRNESNKNLLLEKFRYGSDLDINTISSKLVIQAIENLLK